SYLVIERVIRVFFEDAVWANNRLTRLMAGIATYGAVCIAWVFFRASNFSIATRMLRGMFGGHPDGDAILSTREILQIGIVTACMILAHLSLHESKIDTTLTPFRHWIVIDAQLV